jgi:hypothetical protein
VLKLIYDHANIKTNATQMSPEVCEYNESDEEINIDESVAGS